MFVKLTRDNWATAAYQALVRGGPRAVSIVQLAEELDVTRGSFYHYFSDREELLLAALEEWERRATEDFIERASAEASPTDRLHRLLAAVFREPTEPTELAVAERYLGAERHDDRLVDMVVRRVTERRIGFLTDCYLDLGYDRKSAEDRALFAYTVFVGWLHIDETTAGITASRLKRLGYLIEETLIGAGG